MFLLPKTFFLFGNLKTYQTIHAGYRFTCSTCFKSFSRPYQLKVHGRIQRGEISFVCSESFSVAQELKTHIIANTGEKPLTCFDCQQKFSLSSSLKRHQKKLHPTQSRKTHTSPTPALTVKSLFPS